MSRNVYVYVHDHVLGRLPPPSQQCYNSLSPMGRKRTEIHADQFRKRVSDEEFMSCVKIGVTEAKKILAPKELARVSTEHPGERGAERLVIKHPKAPRKN